MLILGQKEEENNSVSVRKRDSGDLGEMDREAFAGFLTKEAREAETNTI